MIGFRYVTKNYNNCIKINTNIIHIFMKKIINTTQFEQKNNNYSHLNYTFADFY